MRTELQYMRLALRLARRGYGVTSPNPMVGAILVKRGRIIGSGWHRRAGEAHAEIEAIRDAEQRKQSIKGATLYVTLEPCCTQGRTPPCTQAIIAAGIKKSDGWRHRSKPAAFWPGFCDSKASLCCGVPWRVGGRNARHLTRLSIIGSSMALLRHYQSRDESRWQDATAAGESKWITSEPARNFGMELRQRADAILVGLIPF